MKVVEIEKNICLTTTFYDPHPSRFFPDDSPLSERKLPLVYECDRCQTEISFKTRDLEKHCYSQFTNLDDDTYSQFAKFIIDNGLAELSFLDFKCPKCGQAVKILFRCGPSGYWGEFFFEIEKVLVLRQ